MSWLPAPAADHAAIPFRLPVQYIVRADNFRGYAGTVVAGSVRPGRQGRGQRQGRDHHGRAGPGRRQGRREAKADEAVVLTLETETDVTRGDLIVAPAEGLSQDQYPRPAVAFAADLVWTGEEELRHGRSYLLLAGSLAVPAVVTAIRNRRDVVSGEEMAARTFKMNDVGLVEISTDTPVPLDPYTPQPGHRRLPARRAGQPGHRGGRAGAARAAPCAQRRPAHLHRRPRGPRDAEEPAPAGAVADRVCRAPASRRSPTRSRAGCTAWACTPTSSTATASAPA